MGKINLTRIKMDNLGRGLILFFIVLLPWSVMISVAGVLKFDIPILRYWKEIYLIAIGVLFIIELLRKRISLKYDSIDLLIFLFTLWLIVITFLNHRSLLAYVYGLRYDLEFLITFLLFRRLLPLYKIGVGELSRLFLISGGVMIATALIVRYVMDDYLLTFFGFDSQVSGFSGGSGWPPKVYYVIEGTNTIRFQGLLEGPNQMAYFLLVYIAFFWFYFWSKKAYRFIFVVFGILCVYLLFITYSRSALVGAILSGICVFLLHFLQRRKDKKQISWKKFLPITLIAIFIITFTGLLSRNNIHELLVREGSTRAHFERMMIGVERFLAHPSGVGLGEAGPASRGVYDVNNTTKFSTDIMSVNNFVTKIAARNSHFYLMSEYFYIPESWYIQQLIQGGLVGFFLFLGIMGTILVRIWNSYPMVWLLGAVIIMNAFLHAFESMYVSLLLFSMLAIFVPVGRSLSNNIGKKYFSS